MPGVDQSHYGGSYRYRASAVRRSAYLNPNTVCWRCRLTLAEIRKLNPKRKIVWHAGHLIDGSSSSPLMPEHSLCNDRAGAKLAQDRRGLNPSRRWK